eukprot:CAMPEP_0203878584 /NCGR_PEP_ID=MMETSP0359-20131031/23112_1 /ASSEMBLY_ACC=CAM_ASM_000338 /TAXON_ID=268821 /ORGANISM="Scrippsiella Hangoei, Strain SHTV-5" /LENGTH=256 /DNA_ID=CAMNT_0050797805 /DNA_START=80 /DNA_END=847 /DNA_ORIENTATION=+
MSDAALEGPFITLKATSLAGNTLEVSLPADSTVRTLQERLSTSLDVFPGQIRLIPSESLEPVDPSCRVCDLPSTELSYVLCGSGVMQAMTGSREGSLTCLDLTTGKCWRSFVGHDEPVNCAAVDFRSQRAVTGSDDALLKLWHLGTGECLRALHGHSDAIVCVEVDFVLMLALSGSDDDTLRLWNLDTGQVLQVLMVQRMFVASVCCVAADFVLGRAASGSADNSVRLWDLDAGECLHTFTEHRHYVQAVCADFHC